MNAIRLAAVCAIVKTVLIFFIIDIEEELRQKVHDEQLSSVFENNDEDPEGQAPRGQATKLQINKMASIAIIIQ